MSEPMAFPSGAHAVWAPNPGMSLRDYFAAAALQGMLAYSHVNPSNGNYHENCTVGGVARVAYTYADAMLAERAKEAK